MKLLEYYCCDSLHRINKSFQVLLGNTPSLLLAEKTVKRNVFVGLGLISGGKLLISHYGSLGSVQVRSCGIYAAQIILGGSLFSKYFSFFLSVIMHPCSILISYYRRYETGTLGAQYQGSLCPPIISTTGVGELHWDGDVGTTVELGAESQYPYTGTTSVIAMLLISQRSLSIVHVEEQIIKATQNLLYSSSVHNSYYTAVFILKNDVNRADWVSKIDLFLSWRNILLEKNLVWDS